MGKTYARINEGVVAEIRTLPDTVKITDAIHPDLVKQWIAAPDKVEQGWTYDSKLFAAPVVPETDLATAKTNGKAQITAMLDAAASAITANAAG